MNSWTSLPRSPTRPMTLTSAAVYRAIIPSRTDFPTPDPEKIPMRCPRQQVRKVLMARTPRSTFPLTLFRAWAGGAGLEGDKDGPHPPRGLFHRPAHPRRSPLSPTNPGLDESPVLGSRSRPCNRAQSPPVVHKAVVGHVHSETPRPRTAMGLLTAFGRDSGLRPSASLCTPPTSISIPCTAVTRP